MLKKLTLMAVSVAALLAFAAPAAHASGALITDAKGNAATEINGVSTNTTTTTANGTLECSTVTLNGKITTNSNTTAHGENGTGTANGTPGVNHTGHCKVGSIPVHITAINIKTIHLTRHSDGKEPPTTVTTGTADFTYTYQLTTIFGTAHCTFEGKGVTVTRTGADTINANGKLVRTAGGGLCAAEGTLNGDFTVTDQNKEPVVIH